MTKEKALQKIKENQKSIRNHKQFIKDIKNYGYYGSDVAFIIASEAIIQIKQKEIKELKKLYKI